MTFTNVALVGYSDGPAEGAAVGAEDGFMLGPDGIAVGVTLGEDGDDVGTCEGGMLRRYEGLWEGLIVVGACEGPAEEGPLEGSYDGRSDGVEVVGQKDGTVVGTSVTGISDGLKEGGFRVGSIVVWSCEGWDECGVEYDGTVLGTSVTGIPFGLKEGASVGFRVGAIDAWGWEGCREDADPAGREVGGCIVDRAEG